MNRKKVILLTIILVVVVLTAAVAGAAAETFGVRWNSALGGGAGGGTSNSATFRLVGSEMGAISAGSTSASYQMCVGFLCGGNVWNLLLPVIYRQGP